MSSKASADDHVAKKSKVNESVAQSLPSSLIVSFKSQEGEAGGTPSVDLSVDTTSKQLELLINSLLSHEDSV
jgi:hypothetical protein